MVSGDGGGFERFAAELMQLGGQARLIASRDLADAVAASSIGCRRSVVGEDLGAFRSAITEGLSASGCVVVPAGRDQAASADLGVTGGLWAVASTGSVLVAADPGAPRTTGLLPQRHLIVLPEERLLPGLEELFEQLPDVVSETSAAVLVTGPSRTSDIEMISVRGVHGPGRVMVLLVST